MRQVCRIGLDIAKLKFQVHGVDMHGKDMFNKQLQRKDVLTFFANLPICLVGLEACGGAHYWAREIRKLGHDARLISPRLVKPFVINNKTDAADARAICEVVGRPSTKFVNVKTVEQQDLMALHRIRERLVGNRTALVNQIRGLLHESGIVLPQGIQHFRKQFPILLDCEDTRITAAAKIYFAELHQELCCIDEQLLTIHRRIEVATKANEDCVRLLEIPGVGILTASAIVAHMGDARQFKNGREFAACLGLTPRECSSGGKQKILGLSKRGNPYLRKLLIQGARVIVRYWAACSSECADWRKRWVQSLTTRRGQFVAAAAQANKTARIIWNVLAKGERYRVNPQPS